jgi:hypothetical protein
MSNTSYTTNKISKQELFQRLPFLQGDGKIPNVFTFKNVRRALALGSHAEEDFATALQNDIDENIDILKSITSMVLENGIENSSVQAVRGDVVQVEFESGTQFIKNNFSEVFYNVFYEELLEKVGEPFKSFARDAKDFKTKYNLIKKETSSDDKVLGYLLEQSKERIKDGLEGIFTAYFNNPLTIALKKKEEMAVKMNPKTVATIYEDAQHTIVFPLSEEEIKKYEKTSVKNQIITEINELVKSPTNKFFKKVEVDISDSREVENQVENLKKVKETLEVINAQNLTLADKFVFRIRKFGKHDSKYRILNGVYMPANQEIQDPTIAVKTGVGGAGAVMHELAHLIDLTQFANDPMRNTLVSYLVGKVDTNNMRKQEKVYYTKPTEVIARYIELGHTLKYPETSEHLIRLSKPVDYYKQNSAIYFDFANWGEQEKSNAIDFYDVFCENTMGKETKETVYAGLFNDYKTKRQEQREQTKTTTSKLTAEQLAEKRLLTVLREYDSEMVKYVLDSTARKEKNGEYNEFSQVENITMFLSFLGAGVLTPYNRQADLKDRTTVKIEQMARVNAESLGHIVNAFKQLSPEQQLEVIGSQGQVSDLAKILRLVQLKNWRSSTTINGIRARMLELNTDITNFEMKSDYGMLNAASQSDINNYIQNHGEKFNEILGDMLDKSTQDQKIKQTIELFDIMTKEDGFGVVITDEDVKLLYLSLIDYGNRHGKYTVTRQVDQKNQVLTNLIMGMYSELDSLRWSNTVLTETMFEKMVDERLEFFLSKKNKGSVQIPADLILRDKTYNLPEVLKSKETIQQLIKNNNPATQSLLNAIKDSMSPLQVLEMFKDSLTEEEIKFFRAKQQYQISKVIPQLKAQFTELSKIDLTKELVKITGITDEKSLSNIPRTKAILSLVKGVQVSFEQIEYLKELSESVKAGTAVVFEYDGFEDNLIYANNDDEESLNKVMDSLPMMTEMIEELDEGLTDEEKTEILAETQFDDTEMTIIKEALKTGDFESLVKLYENQLLEVINQLKQPVTKQPVTKQP